MPTWGEQLKELARLQAPYRNGEVPKPGTPSPHDVLRRKYLARLSSLTGRAVIVYATAWTESKEVPSDGLSVGLGDVHGFMEVVSNIDERNLDLILHSPGGSAEAAEAVMSYLRTRFDHIRAVIPVAAMSAATMMALSCDEIVMGAHSQLGPVDPQLTIFTPEGPRSAPGQAIIDQFEKAKVDCQNPANIAAWLPILRGYGPGLLAVCQSQRELAEEFVARELTEHMFEGEPDAGTKARRAAEWFADFTEFRSHGRRVSRDAARGQGIVVRDMEEDHELQDAMLSVFHAVAHTFTGTPSFKVIENQHGRAFIQQMQSVRVNQGPGKPAGPGTPASPGVQPGRAERRRAQREKAKKGQR